MTTATVSSITSEKIEAVLKIFREAKGPLTLAQVAETAKAAKISRSVVEQIVEEQVLEGHLFRCAPVGKSKRYWVHDEEQKIREAIEEKLAGKQLNQNVLIDLVVGGSKKITTKPAVMRCIEAMSAEGVLYPHPGVRGAKVWSLERYDVAKSIGAKKVLMDELVKMANQASTVGVKFEAFVDGLRHALAPRVKVEKKAKGATKVDVPKVVEVPKVEDALSEVETLILKGMRDLDPQVDLGAGVMLRDLRRLMPKEYQTHEVFDKAVIRLAEEQKVVIHRHDHPGKLTEKEKDELVLEGGTYFTLIALRV